MRRLTQWVAGALFAASALGGGLAGAQAAQLGTQPAARPNLVGQWELDVAKTDFGPTQPWTALTRRVELAPNAITTTTTQTGGTGTSTTVFKCALDATPCANTAGDQSLKSKVSWEGSVLVITTETSVSGTDVTAVDRWSVSPDGKVLTIDRQFSTAAGDASAKLVLNRK